MSANGDPGEEMPYSEVRSRHLPASEARLYESHADLAPPDAVLWWEKFVGPYTAASAIAAGLSLDDAVLDQESRRHQRQAEASRREQRAREWQAVGVDASEMAAAEAAGLAPEDVRPWREDRLAIAQLHALVSHGATPEYRAEWLKQGFRLKDVAVELSRGVGVAEISSIARDQLLWLSIPESSRSGWKAMPVNPSDVLVWRSEGLRPIDVLLSGYVDPGAVASAGEIAIVVDEDDRGHYWFSEPTSLGADQMERLTAIEVGRRSPEFLERFGFKVEKWSLRQEWLEREIDGISIVAGNEHHCLRVCPDHVILEHRVTGEGGSEVEILGKFPTLPDAVKGFIPTASTSADGHPGIELTTSMALPELLSLTQPWAEPLGKARAQWLTFDGTFVVARYGEDAVWRLLPEDLQAETDFDVVDESSANWLPGGPCEFVQRETIGVYGDLLILIAQGDTRNEVILIGPMAEGTDLLDVALPYSEAYERASDGSWRYLWTAQEGYLEDY